MQRKLMYFIDGFLTLSQIATCYKLFKLCDLFLLLSNKLLLTASNVRASNFRILALVRQFSKLLANSTSRPKSWIWKLFTAILHIQHQVLYIILFCDFIQDPLPPAHCQGTIKDPEKISTPLNLGTPESPPTPTVNQVQFTIMFKR